MKAKVSLSFLAAFFIFSVTAWAGSENPAWAATGVLPAALPAQSPDGWYALGDSSLPVTPVGVFDDTLSMLTLDGDSGGRTVGLDFFAQEIAVNPDVFYGVGMMLTLAVSPR